MSSETELRAQALQKKLRDGFTYVSDNKQFGKEDWRSSAKEMDEKGEFSDDCDGFACTAAELLIDEGEEEKNVRLITCWTETGGYHLVCGVDTDDDTLVLDNRHKRVKGAGELLELGYKFHKGMRISEAPTWRTIG